MGKNTPVFIKISIAVVLWGGSFIATKIAIRDISPLSLVWLRFTMGVIILGLATASRRQFSLPRRSEIPFLALLGFIGITFHQWLQSTGLVTSQANTTAWIVASIPVFTAILGWIVLKEVLKWVQAAGIILAASGVLLIVSGGNVSSLFNGRIGNPGDLLILVSALNWAIFSVLSRRILKTHPAVWTMFYVMLFGWVFNTLLLITVGKGLTEFTNLTSSGWIAVAFLGILCSGIAYIFYYEALEALSASRVTVFVYLEPLVTMVLSAWILGETMGLAALIGGAVILMGVWLVQQSR